MLNNIANSCLIFPNSIVSNLDLYWDGVPFANAVANNTFRVGKVIAFDSLFVDTANVAPATPKIFLDNSLIGKVKALTHVIQVQNNDTNAWYDTFVDANPGEILSVPNFLAPATRHHRFIVVPITKDAITEGKKMLVDLEDLISPLQAESRTTKLQPTNFPNQQRPPNPPATPFTIPTTPLSVPPTAFYIIYKVHDYAYKYGWTEMSYNFQSNTFGKGGADSGDRWSIWDVQDVHMDSDSPSARWGPPERYHCTWIYARNNHLTEGGTRRCLQITEASGIGESWSDAMAEYASSSSLYLPSQQTPNPRWIEHKDATVPDYALATWVFNNLAGVRTCPYSTNTTVNPSGTPQSRACMKFMVRSLLAFQCNPSFNTQYPDVGEVRENMLHNVYAALVQAHGISSTAMDDPSGPEGNIFWLHLFIDALSLQPCNPTLPNARDVWIQADQNRYDGVNKCALWNAFASRGLGVNAANYVNDTSVPSGC
ncbi:Fungalysin metallopeptidase-domain-containing protein [Desarmillaria tabescens]|uniref:Extracellular metalloproteinase n=1 Tax=Armillaria tabescens TaxID=1929756 RepID=A0AA39NB06_ARMTA|nr:Fungalysin metallopeptidase-domain-containing protein [Desarmillaria tabescens]KAK0462294.1 Fungalysin metallopeptidase-domain-containing protein [Desarmillaria tabescens]